MINGWLLGWRMLMRALSPPRPTAGAKGLLSIPRLVVGNVIAILAAARAVSLHLAVARRAGTRPTTSSRGTAAVRPSLRSSGSPWSAGAACVQRRSACFPAPRCSAFRTKRSQARRRSSPTQFPADRAARPGCSPLRSNRSSPRRQCNPTQPLPRSRHGCRPILSGRYLHADAARNRPMPTAGPFLCAIAPLDEWPLSSDSLSLPCRRAVSRPWSRPDASIPASAGDAARLDRLQFTAGRCSQSTHGHRRHAVACQRRQRSARARRAPPRPIISRASCRATLRTSAGSGAAAAKLLPACAIQPARASLCGSPPSAASALGRSGGGRNAFAIFFEGGVYDRPMPLALRAGWLSAGRSGRRHEPRPLPRRRHDHDAAGDAARFRRVRRVGRDAAGRCRGSTPARASRMQVRNNMRVHFDWRQRARRQCPARLRRRSYLGRRLLTLPQTPPACGRRLAGGAPFAASPSATDGYLPPDRRPVGQCAGHHRARLPRRRAVRACSASAAAS